MNCPKCNALISDSSEFCPHCGNVFGENAAPLEEPKTDAADTAPEGAEGAVTEAAPETALDASSETVSETPILEAPKKKLSRGAIAAISVAAAVAVASVGFVVATLFAPEDTPMGDIGDAIEDTITDIIPGLSTPEKTVGKALKKTAEEIFAPLSEAEALASYMEESEKVNRKDDVVLSFVSSDSEELKPYEGIGISISSNINSEESKGNGSVSVFYEDVELADIDLIFRKDAVAIASNAFTEGKYYGVDLNTLKEDIASSPLIKAYVGEIDKETVDQLFGSYSADALSFADAETISGLTSVVELISEEMKLDESEEKSITVNGAEILCDIYTYSIPMEIVKEKLIPEIFELLVDEDMMTAEDVEAVKAELDKIKSMNGKIAVKDGYLRYADFVNTVINGDGTENTGRFIVEVGTDTDPLGALSFTVKAGENTAEAKLTLTRNYDKAAGRLFGELSFSELYYMEQETYTAIELDLSYDISTKDACPFIFKLNSDDGDVLFEISGSFPEVEGGRALDLDGIVIKYGDAELELTGSHTVTAYEETDIAASEYENILIMTEDEANLLIQRTAVSFYAQLLRVYDKVPFIADFVESMGQ